MKKKIFICHFSCVFFRFFIRLHQCSHLVSSQSKSRRDNIAPTIIYFERRIARRARRATANINIYTRQIKAIEIHDSTTAMCAWLREWERREREREWEPALTSSFGYLDVLWDFVFSSTLYLQKAKGYNCNYCSHCLKCINFEQTINTRSNIVSVWKRMNTTN